MMGDKIVKLLIFGVGAAIGSVVTWKFVKTKYERIADEEIESVKKIYNYKKIAEEHAAKPEVKVQNVVEVEPKVNQDRVDYSKLTVDLGYTNESKEGGEDMCKKPYVIAPEEFGEMDDYETVSLTYYSDGVLTDDFDNEIEDVEGMVGEDSLDHFGEYEDDSVFVRNDRYKTDYEILLDLRKYSDVKKSNPN